MSDSHRDAYLDALAFSRAMLRDDYAGRMAVARACDPVAMVDALAALYLGLIGAMTGTANGVDACLAYMQEHINDMLPGGGTP